MLNDYIGFRGSEALLVKADRDGDQKPVRPVEVGEGRPDGDAQKAD